MGRYYFYGVLSLIFAFVFSPIGLILGIIGVWKSWQVGEDASFHMYGLALSLVFLFLQIITIIALIK